jgi:hypothetical protein
MSPRQPSILPVIRGVSERSHSDEAGNFVLKYLLHVSRLVTRRLVFAS